MKTRYTADELAHMPDEEHFIAGEYVAAHFPLATGISVNGSDLAITRECEHHSRRDSARCRYVSWNRGAGR